jgi:hypothetical protein
MYGQGGKEGCREFFFFVKHQVEFFENAKFFFCFFESVFMNREVSLLVFLTIEIIFYYILHLI